MHEEYDYAEDDYGSVQGEDHAEVTTVHVGESDPDADEHRFETADGGLESCGNILKVPGTLQTLECGNIRWASGQDKQPRELFCWNCTLSVDGPPIGAVEHYDARRNTFYLFGSFCSFNCAKRYLLQRNRPKDHLRCEHLALLYRRVRALMDDEKKQKVFPLCITPSPPRQVLLRYGGYVTDEEYRRMVNKVTVRELCKVDAVFLESETRLLQVNNENTVHQMGVEEKNNGGTLNRYAAVAGADNKETQETTLHDDDATVVNKRGKTSTKGKRPSSTPLPTARKMPNFGDVFTEAANKSEAMGASTSAKQRMKAGGLKLARKEQLHKVTEGTLDSFMKITKVVKPTAKPARPSS